MIDLVHRANLVRRKLELPNKEFMVLILAPGLKACNDLRSGLQWGLGSKLYAADILIEFIDLDSKDLHVVRGISALHCLTLPEYMANAPVWLQKAVRASLAVSADALGLSVEELITGPEAFKESS